MSAMRRFVQVVPVLFVVAVGAWAQQPPASPTTSKSATDSTETSLAAARRDLEAIKSSRNPVAPQSNDLQRATMPELQVGAPRGIWGPGGAKKKLETGEKSKNWLVEAMEKDRKLDATGAPKDDRRWTETESERSLTRRDQLRAHQLGGDETVASAERSADSTRTEAGQDRAQSATPPAAANPLAGFLAGWMTPNDFALLQSSQKAGTTSDGVTSAGPTARGPTPELSTNMPTGGIGDFGAVFGSGVRAVPAAAPRENPYLESLMPATPPPITVLPAAVSMPVSTPARLPDFAAGPPPVFEAPRSKVPDFAKPPTDDTYFKQLKRF